MKVFKLVSAVFGILLFGVATGAQLVELPAPSSEEIESSNSRIYIIRSDQNPLSLVATIKSNGEVIGSLSPLRFLSFATSSDTLQLEADAGGVETLKLTLNTTPHSNHFVVLESTRGIFQGLDRFEEISREEALWKLMRLKPAAKIADREHWFPYGMVKSFYLQASLGLIAKTRFSGVLKDKEEQLRSETGEKQESGQVDMFGFYFPMSNNKTLLGVQLIGWGWNYYANEWFNRFNNSLSALHYFSGVPGRGVFLRGDIGKSRISIEHMHTRIYHSSESGKRYLAGIGYGFRFDNSSFIIGLNNEYASYKSGSSNTQFLSVGWMW